MKSFKEQQEQWEVENLNIYAKRSCKAKRWKYEEPDLYRTDYQRDVARILYSDAFRRLRMKTQVFPASGLDQHNRTRLTHSIEVAQIAKSIARPLRLNVDLVEAISLGHDLGHTPFGHAGERALSKCLSGKNTFKHNAQSIWILQKTNAGYTNEDGSVRPGFNLTYDVLDGILKHTKICNPNEFKGLEKLNPGQPSSLEGQTVELSDEIAYLKHDLDDALKNNLISEGDIKDIWNKNSDIPFDKSKLCHHFIYDAIQFSDKKEYVKNSAAMKHLFDQLESLLLYKVFRSERISKADSLAEEIITKIYSYYDINFDKLLAKTKKLNKYIFETYGKERTITDYIQWLGDETARAEYKKIQKSQM